MQGVPDRREAESNGAMNYVVNAGARIHFIGIDEALRG